MQNHSDAQLLRQYAAQRAEAAFGEIVARHAGLVYSAALRQLDSPDLARDVAQSVFTDLARKAASLACRPVLTGWLYTSAHFAAAKAVPLTKAHRDMRLLARRGNFVSPTSVTFGCGFWNEIRVLATQRLAPEERIASGFEKEPRFS